MATLKNRINEKLGIDLSKRDLGRSLSLADYETLCISPGIDIKKARNVLFKMREDYFTHKYIDYTYQNDLRGLIPTWANEVKNIIGGFSIDADSCTVVDVGVSNGLELPYLFPDFKKVMSVDVSKMILVLTTRS